MEARSIDDATPASEPLRARDTMTRIRRALARRADLLGPRLLERRVASGGEPRMSRQAVIDEALELGLDELERKLGQRSEGEGRE